MAVIYWVIKLGNIFIPAKRSDDEGWTEQLCHHYHHSEKEARKCLVKAVPKYMKYQHKMKLKVI